MHTLIYVVDKSLILRISYCEKSLGFLQTWSCCHQFVIRPIHATFWGGAKNALCHGLLAALLQGVAQKKSGRRALRAAPRKSSASATLACKLIVCVTRTANTDAYAETGQRQRAGRRVTGRTAKALSIDCQSTVGPRPACDGRASLGIARRAPCQG